MSSLSMFIILEMSLLYILFFNVAINAASVFSEVKLLDCLHRFSDGVLGNIIVSGGLSRPELLKL